MLLGLPGESTKLYIYTVFFHIYRMRSAGRRISSTELTMQKPAQGWLVFKRSPMDSYGPPRMEAHLLDQQGGKDLIPPLYYARLVRMDGVMHLSGHERIGRNNTKSNTRPAAQSWLCAMSPSDALPLLRKVRVSSATGFTDDDDDEGMEEFPPLG